LASYSLEYTSFTIFFTLTLACRHRTAHWILSAWRCALSSMGYVAMDVLRRPMSGGGSQRDAPVTLLK